MRISAGEEAKKTCHVAEDLRQRLNDTDVAFHELVNEVQALRKELVKEKSHFDWALAFAPIGLIFLLAMVVLLLHVKQRTAHTKTRRLVREMAKDVKAGIDNLSAACFMSTPPPPKLGVKRQGQSTNEVTNGAMRETVHGVWLVSGSPHSDLQQWQGPQCGGNDWAA